MSVLEGDPRALASSVAALQRGGHDIDRARDDLMRLRVGGTAESVEAIAGQLSASARDLTSVLERYRAATAALATFQHVLARAHARAENAAAALDAAERDRAGFAAQATQLEAHAMRLREQPEAHLGMVQDVEERARRARWHEESLGRQRDDAAATIEAARREVDDAARVAIAGIDAGFEGTSDGFRDRLAAAKDWLQDGWDAVGEWFDDVVGPAIDQVREWMAEAAEWIGAAALVVGALGALAAALASPAFAATLTAAVVDIMNGGDSEFGFAVVESLAATFLAGGVSMLAASEWLRPDRVVRLYGEGDSDYSTGQGLAVGDLQGNVPTTAQDLVRGMKLVDEAGGDEHDQIGVMDIRQIAVYDGQGRFVERRWIVTLPSTQAHYTEALPWAHDEGATNDWTSNAALYWDAMTGAGGPTQYERAVLDAMEKAGIGADEPVLMAGFSQGGYMAHRMALDHSDTYNIQGIVVAGSPVDRPPLGDDKIVVQYTNPDDTIVHQVDGVYDAPETSKHLQHFSSAGEHNAHHYVETAGDVDPRRAQQTDDLLRDFLVKPGERYRTSSVQMEWNE